MRVAGLLTDRGYQKLDLSVGHAWFVHKISSV